VGKISLTHILLFVIAIFLCLTWWELRMIADTLQSIEDYMPGHPPAF
jgi:uncharacterized membrane protein YwzB